jgi:hypothetical protein
MPTACAGEASASPCTPPPAFVDALCAGGYLEASLSMFAKGTPWTRAYLRGDVDGWYASGSGSPRTKLVFDEETLVLRVRNQPTTGVVVSGGGASYDVLRWDGYCYTLDEGEVTLKAPPKAKHPSLPFHHLSEATQATLLRDEKVRAARTRRGKECKGAMMGDVTLACEQADRALGDAIVQYLVSGGTLPAPARIPGQSGGPPGG